MNPFASVPLSPTPAVGDLDHPVADQHAFAVQHAALDADGARRALVDERLLRDHPEFEERPDGLGRRARQAHALSSGVAPLPPSTMS
jgi:hypothetical protein